MSESAARAFCPASALWANASDELAMRAGSVDYCRWRYRDIREDDCITTEALCDFSLAQQQMSGFYISSNGETNPYAMLPAIHQAARRTDPRRSLPPAHVGRSRARHEVAPKLFDDAVSRARGVALFLALIALTASSARPSERTSEIGLRMALGAGRGEVLQLITGQGFDSRYRRRIGGASR